MMLTAWHATTPSPLLLGEQCPSLVKSWEEQADLPCHWGPGGRRARAVGLLGIRPLTRLGGVQLTCLDLSPPIAIFQRKGKILRESHKRTLSLRLTDRLNLRVSPISSGTLLQLWQSCSLQRRAATAWDFMYPEHHFKPNCCINCCAQVRFAPLHSLQKGSWPHTSAWT